MAAAAPLNRAASLAFALDRCTVGKPVMIVLPQGEAREFGRPSLHGLAGFRPGTPLLLVMPGKTIDALWTMEQALKSGALGGVLGVVEGAELTSTRRLDFAARDGGTPGFLLRARGGGLSAARRRWRVGAMPSAPNPFDAEAPGALRLAVELVRQRDGPPGTWILEHDVAAGGFLVVPGLAAERLDEAARRAA